MRLNLDKDNMDKEFAKLAREYNFMFHDNMLEMHLINNEINEEKLFEIYAIMSFALRTFRKNSSSEADTYYSVLVEMIKESIIRKGMDIHQCDFYIKLCGI